MSTNYYFRWKNENLDDVLKELEKYLNKCRLPDRNIRNLMDNYRSELEELNLIHIGKASMGKPPIFQVTKYYSSLREIEYFYKNYKESLDIIDEYGDKLTIEELREKLFLWNTNEKEIDYYGGIFKDYDFH